MKKFFLITILLVSIIFNFSQHRQIASLKDSINKRNIFYFKSHVAQLQGFKDFKVSKDNNKNYNYALDLLMDLTKSSTFYKIRNYCDIRVSMFYSRCINHYTDILRDIKLNERPEDMNKLKNLINDISMLADWLDELRKNKRYSYRYEEITLHFKDRWKELNKLIEYEGVG